MNIKKTLAPILSAFLLLAPGCRKESSLSISLPDKYEGKTVEIITYGDSSIIASASVSGNKADFILPDSITSPTLASVVIDGRIRAFYIVEPGKAVLTDSMNVASGTPMNERFSRLMTRLDSVEALDDMDKYVDFAEKTYNENKDNALATYFGIEWLKYAEPSKIDSMMSQAPESFRNSRRTAYYLNFARLRAATAPGQKYTDVTGESADGAPISMASYIQPGKYTMIDFWASWCPYCIKELPEMVALRDKWKEKGFEIVGVAVRDKPEDTKTAIEKHGMTWPVVFNTERRAYDIYGFSGIPHHILLGPDGTIISRGESLRQIDARLEKAISGPES